MKYVVVLLVGFLIGFGFARHHYNKLSVTPSVDAVAQQTEESESPPQETTEFHSQGTTATAQAPAPNPTPLTAPPQQSAAAPTPPPAQGELLNLSISDRLATELEQDWEDLPSQLHVMKEERGWRVMYVQEDSLVAETGLRNGDLITRESLEALNRDGNQLATRVSRILNHVSVY